MTYEPITIIGIGADGPAGLSAEARAHVDRAAVLAGGKRHLAFFPDWPGETIFIEADSARWLDQLERGYRERKTVVLASGDPLFYGVGRMLLDKFPREDLVFVPHISSVQLAFARIKETWNDARLVSLHGRGLECLRPALDERAAKIAILTDARNHPAAIARLLRELGLDHHYRLWVGENLGGLDERVTHWAPGEMLDEAFSPLNVVVLVRIKDVINGYSGIAEESVLLGIPETAFRHEGESSRGLITKREIRLLALCYLEPRPSDVFWDVGAGSGSVAIEAARWSPRLRVFAIERSPQRVLDIEENLKSFGLTRVQVVRGTAPEALADLPDPDAVFIGGSGGRLMEVLAACGERLRPGGRLVLNCVTLENFARAWEWLRENDWTPEATAVQISHSRPLGSLTCFEPEHPITIVRATKARRDV